VKASGNCKCTLVGDYQGVNGKVLFVGDGGSDFCASGRADFVLAKLKLIGYCRQEDIAHLAISGFDEAVRYLHANHVPATAVAF
jgi:2-hydroxy-3-keto-5-methylthiopentenyl-1-phosphate phosphatase